MAEGRARSQAGHRGASRDAGTELPAVLFAGLPAVLLAAIFLIYVGDPAFYGRYLATELGVIENATALAWLVSVIFAVATLARARLLPRRWLALWIGLVGLGGFYIAGEEISWGQHWFGWATPDGFQRLNDQGEINLHNMSSWLDQKPRAALELAVLVGGVVLPLIFRFAKPRWQGARGDWRWWFLPGWVCFPAAAFAIAVRLPERGAKLFDWDFFRLQYLRFSELQELCFALFLVFYLASIYLRLRRPRP